ELRACEATLAVDGARVTRLAIQRGRAVARVGSKSVEVLEGQGAVLRPGEAPGAPRPLPAPPAWTTPPAEAVEAADTAELSGAYDAGAGPAAARFHLQVAR